MFGFAGLFPGPERPLTDTVRAHARSAAAELGSESGLGAEVTALRDAILLTPRSIGTGVTCAVTPRTIVILDGIVDTIDEIRAELDHSDRSAAVITSADILAHGYGLWGADLLRRLSGCLAIVLFDRASGTLLAATDKLGSVPLYVVPCDGGTLFTTSLSAITRWPGMRCNADPDVVAHLLAFGTVPPDLCVLSGVHRIRPGHRLRQDSEGTRDEARYLGPFVDRASSAAPRRDAVQQELGDLLSTAATRMPSSETEPATLRDQLPKVLLALGEPILWPAPVASLAAIASRPASAGTVSLLGVAELLVARPHYRTFSELVATGPSHRPASMLHAGFHATPPFVRDLYFSLVGLTTDAERLTMAGPTMAHTLLFSPVDRLGTSLEDVDAESAGWAAATLELDQGSRWFQPGILTAARRLGGKTVLAPGLDGDVVRSCLELKPAQRRSLAALVPAEPSDLPVGSWLRGPLRSWMLDVLRSRRFIDRGLFSTRWLEAEIGSHLAGERDYSRTLWAALILETWLSGMTDRRAQRRPELADMPVEGHA
jgi:asparagine synthase (glutamine-hydrolysing)